MGQEEKGVIKNRETGREDMRRVLKVESYKPIGKRTTGKRWSTERDSSMDRVRER